MLRNYSQSLLLFRTWNFAEVKFNEIEGKQREYQSQIKKMFLA